MRAHTYALRMPRQSVWSRVCVVFLVGLVGLFVACASLREAEAPARELFGCTTRALEPVAGTYERAEMLAEDLRAQRVNVPEILDAAHATGEEAQHVYAELYLCKRAFEDAIHGGGGDAGVTP